MIESTNPLISVIVPIYNVEVYVKKCIRSIMEQKYTNIEIICVDDCSPDNSIKIVEQLQKEDSRIKILTHKYNQGSGESRNTGMRAMKGEYVAFVDSDDYIHKDMIYDLLYHIKLEKADLCLCAFQEMFSCIISSSYGKIISFNEDSLHSCILDYKIIPAPWNKLYKASLLLNLSFIGRYAEDLLFTISYLSKCKKITFIPNAYY